jgi:uncharacterized protein HemY
MLKRFLGFLLLGALLIGFGSLFYQNPGAVEFRITPSRAYSLPLPLLLLIAFFLGAVAIFVLALVRETQWTLADRRRRRRERKLDGLRTAIAASRDLAWYGQHDQARSLLRRKTGRAEEVESAVILAESSLASGRLDEAKAILEQSLERHPDHPRLLALKSSVLERQNESQAATAALEQAVAREPDSPRLVEALRDSYVRERRWEDAVRAQTRVLGLLRSAAEIASEQRRLRGLRYEAALALENSEEVLRELRAQWKQDPSFLPAAVSLADILEQIGQQREAGRVCLRTVRMRPAPVLLARIETLYRATKRPKKVIALYHRLRKRHDSPLLLHRLVRFLLAEGAVDEAAAELDAAGQWSDDLEYQLLLAEVQRLRGNSELALQAYRTALDPTPTDRPQHVCSACLRSFPDWASRCPACGEWDTFEAVSSAEVAQRMVVRVPEVRAWG